VVLPKANEKDLRDVPENVRREMTFHLAETADDVLAATMPPTATRAALPALLGSGGNGPG
jgi:ATP-dependent Lon protease